MKDPVVIAMAIFVGVCLVLWTLGGGIPYGYDGIEIYFTYLIGHNAAKFRSVNPLMADIAASPDPAAHPYYYTHHPNLGAHLVSQGLIRLGVSDLRWHGLVAIVITASGMLVGAWVVRRMLGTMGAVFFLLISSAHYVGILSWATVLLRSFHFPFFWIAVALTFTYVRTPTSWHLAALGAWTYVLFLNDYALAPFIALLQMTLIALETASIRRTLVFVLWTVITAALAIATWLGVLVHELGWHVVAEDISYTYVARNAGQWIPDVKQMAEFYRQHRIVFWGVLVDTTNLPGALYQYWKNAFTLGHGVVSIALYGAAIYIVVATLARLAPRVMPSSSRLSALLARDRSWWPAGAFAGLAVLLFGLFFGHKLAVWFPLSWSSYALGLGVLAGLIAMWTATQRLRRGTADASIDTLVWIGGATGLVVWVVAFDWLSAARVAAVFAVERPSLYAAALRWSPVVLTLIAAAAIVIPVWTARWGSQHFARHLPAVWPTILVVVAVLVATAIGAGVAADLVTGWQEHQLSWSGLQRNLSWLMIIVGAFAALAILGIVNGHRWAAEWRALGVSDVEHVTPSTVGVRSFVIAFVVATAIMSILSFGEFAANFVYVYKPVLPFLEDVLLAAALVVAVRWLRPSPLYRNAGRAFLCLAVGFYWLSYQASRAYLYPPTELGVTRAVRGETFRGTSFVEEALYAALWYYTRGVAHSVPPTPAANGGLDLDSLMFFHDWNRRRELYRDPQYLACVRQHSQPKFTCERWLARLRTLGYELRPGENILYDEDFLIFRFPRDSDVR